jgi:hypothetical protein
MQIEAIDSSLIRASVSSVVFLAFGVAAAASWAGQVPPMPESSPVVEEVVVDPHMPEALRVGVKKLVIIGGVIPAGESVTGSYDKEEAGLLGGMSDGSRIGTISKEIGGVPVNIPIPVLGTLGAIYGGLSGAAKAEIQEFRDALTDELVRADSPPLRSDGLALDAFWAVRRLPSIDSHLFAPTTPMPNDADSILYVNLDGLTIDVQGDEAIITTSATATLHRLSDGKNVYETVIYYQDRDELKNWTANDNALWREYTNFARHYLGREIAADVFDRVELQHELRPVQTDTAKVTKKDKLKFASQSLTPTLAWEFEIKNGDPYGSWPENLDESAISWDIEIFENRQLAYYEKQVPDASHTLIYELEPCKTYRWSVRPVYQVGNDIRFGEWMRFAPDIDKDDEGEVETRKGLFGRAASVAPAYILDFALLEIECKRK